MPNRSVQIFAVGAFLLATTVASAQYAGLYITEIASTPTADEFIEIINSTASAIDISGVIISDEDDSNTEGASAFPAATSIAAGEIILVVANNSATEPSFLDTLPTNTRVFVEAGRNSGTWTTVNGVTLTAMVDFTAGSGGTSNNIAISGGDGAALYAPSTTFVAGPANGPTPLTNTIDGMNYNNTDTGARNPINPTGLIETQAQRVGTAEASAGNGYARLSLTANTDSSLLFAQAAITPGVFSPSAVSDWQMME
jgi:predicted extracellular nuclease